jgi:hypothetical protein
MDRNQILKLAVEALEKQKEGINAEIEMFRAELEGAGSRTTKQEKSAVPRTRKRGPQSKAARRAQSQRMREYWAAKRAQVAKLTAAVATSPDSAKRRRKTAAEKGALSLKMKQVWAKRKAEAKKKTPKRPPKE